MYSLPCTLKSLISLYNVTVQTASLFQNIQIQNLQLHYTIWKAGVEQLFYSLLYGK